MSKNNGELPQPTILSSLKPGDWVKYDAESVTWLYRVVEKDTERCLPVVEIAATQSQEDDAGFPIVDKINSARLRGILLGTCTLGSGEILREGQLQPGISLSGVLVELVQDGDLTYGIFPAPEQTPTIENLLAS